MIFLVYSFIKQMMVTCQGIYNMDGIEEYFKQKREIEWKYKNGL